MNLLILGGTVFLGRHIVDAALRRGHRLTLFNRGRHTTEPFADVERLQGDRNGDMSALHGRRFDCAIDCSGYKPEQMTRAAKALGSDLAHYVYVSSVSAYGVRAARQQYDESTALATGDVGYGEEKARSEETIAAAYPNRVAIVRPGLIVGPHDPTGRFVYWPLRYAKGGAVLAPGRRDKPIQWIDVRDLAEWIVHCAESHIVGAFNAVTQAEAHSMGGLLEACARVANVESSTHWLGDVTLADEKISPWSELPLWIPEEDPDAGGLLLARADRAIAAGLKFRSAEASVRDTLSWAQTLANDHPALGTAKTLSPARERELLEKYKLIH